MEAAVAADDVGAAKVMLDGGADPDQRVGGEERSLLFEASPEMAEVLLAAGADPAAVSNVGVSVIEHATRTGDVQKVRVLLDAGLPPELALIESVAWANPTAVSAVLEYGEYSFDTALPATSPFVTELGLVDLRDVFELVDPQGSPDALMVQELLGP